VCDPGGLAGNEANGMSSEGGGSMATAGAPRGTWPAPRTGRERATVRPATGVRAA